MGTAYLEVTASLMREVLRLPESTEIIGSGQSESGTVKLLIDDPAIPGEAVRVAAVFRTIHGVAAFDKYETYQTRAQCPACGAVKLETKP